MTGKPEQSEPAGYAVYRRRKLLTEIVYATPISSLEYKHYARLVLKQVPDRVLLGPIRFQAMPAASVGAAFLSRYPGGLALCFDKAAAVSGSPKRLILVAHHHVWHLYLGFGPDPLVPQGTVGFYESAGGGLSLFDPIFEEFLPSSEGGGSPGVEVDPRALPSLCPGCDKSNAACDCPQVDTRIYRGIDHA